MAEGTKVGTGYVDIEGNFRPLHRQLEQLRGRWAQQSKGVGESFSRGLTPALNNVTRRVRENTTAVSGFGAQMDRTRQSVDKTRSSLGGFGDELRQARNEVRTAAGWRPAGLQGLSRDLDRLRNTSTKLGTDLRRSSEQSRGGLLGSIGALRGWGSSATRARADALSLERAQIALDLATRRHGASSLQARDAQIRYAQAQDRVDTSSRGAMRSLTGLGSRTTVVNQRFQLLRNALGALKWPAIITGAGLATQALSALGASLVAVASAVGPAVGVLAAVPGALAAAAQGFGVFRLASMGVTDALREQLRNQFAITSGSSQTADASRQVEQAERAQADASRQLVAAKQAVGDAERALRTARRDAARDLVDARRQVVTATRDEQRATYELRDARAALQALQTGPDELDVADARDRTADATRAITDAENDYAEAVIRTSAILNDPTASPLQQARARSELADAENAVEDSRRSLTRATRDLDDLERGPTRRDLAKARLDVADAEGRLADATTTRKRSTADLQELERRGIGRAEQVVQAQRALVQAHQGVRDAQLAIQDAARGAADAQQGVVSTAANLNEEFDRLPRSAQSFVRTLIGLKPRFDELRTVAADGLFPGARAGLLSAMRSFEPVRQVVAATSRTLGGLAAQAGRLLGSRGFGRDLQLVGGRNAIVIRRVGSAAIVAGDALRHVMVAAGPLLGWLSRVTLGWARSARESAKAGRESGRMARFFESTRRVLERLGSITGNVTRAFRGIGRAAAPLGNEILAALDRASEGFARWTSSLGGQRTLRRYFDDARPAIFEMGRLLRDVTKSFFRLGSQPGVARMIRQVRTELLPALERLLGVLQQTFGPALVSALTSVVDLFSQLAGAGGILSSIVRMFDGIASSASWLLKNVPGFKQLTFAVLGLVGAFTALRLAAVITGFATLGRTIARVALAYKALKAGQTAAAVAGSTGVAATSAAQVAASGRIARLFSFGGMLGAAGGRAGVTATGSRLGRILGGSIGRSTTQALGGAGGALAGAVPAGGFSGRLAGRLAAGLRRALPGAIAAAGIGNIVMSAAEGDTKKAMWETGGAAAGGLVGGLVGGLPGALVGSGLGSLAGGLLGKTFGGAADSAGKEIADRMAASISVRLRARLSEIADGEPLAIAQDSTRRTVGPAAAGGRATAPVSPAVRDRAGNTSDAARRLNAVYEQMQRTRVRMSQAEVASLRASVQSLNLTREERREVNRIISLLERGSRLRIGVSAGDSLRTIYRLENAFRGLLAGQRAASKGLSRASADVSAALRRQQRATRNVKDAEAELTAARQQYPAGSRPVLAAERRLRDAKNEHRRATERLGRAERLRGGELEAAKILYRSAWQENQKLVGSLRDEVRQKRRARDAAIEEIRTKGESKARVEALARSQTELNVVTRELGRAQRRSSELVARAAREIGPKYVREMTRAQGAVRDFGGSLQRLQGRSRTASERVTANAGSLATGSTGALEVLVGNTNKALGAFGVRPLAFRFEKVRAQRRQRGGSITPVPGVGSGDKVPALLEPGEVVVNREAVRKMGGPQHVNKINSLIPRFQTGGVVSIDRAVSAINRVDKAQFPYLWGGGHSSSPARFGPFDCSGFVSYVLQQAGVQIPTMVSGALASAGMPGPGAISVFANPDHTLMSVNGRFAGTSGQNPGGGAGWITTPDDGYLSKFTVRHFKALMMELERLKMVGPDGPLKGLGQAAIDKVRKAGNALLRKKSNTTMGGGDFGDLGPGKVVGASVFGDPHDDPTTGYIGYRDNDLRGQDAYAELGMGTSLGGLPYRHPLNISYNGRQVGARKLDIGDGGAPIQGHSTDIDLWHETADKLGIHGLWKGLVSISGLMRGGIVQQLQRGGIGSRIDRIASTLRRPLRGRGGVAGYIAKTLRLIDGIGVPASLQTGLTDLSNQSDIWSEWASRAGALSYDVLYGERTPILGDDGRPMLDNAGRPTFHEPGDPVLDAERRPITHYAEVNGQTEAGWTNSRLGALFNLRNKLVNAKDIVLGEQSRVRDLIEKTKRRIADLTASIRREERRRRRLLAQIRRTERQLSDARSDLTELRRRPRRNRVRIERAEQRIASLNGRLGGLRDQVGEIDQQQQNRTRVRSQLNGVLGADDGGRRTGLLGRQATMAEYLPNVLGSGGDNFKGLVTVQGLGGPLGILPTLPPIGTLGGDIFDAQQILRQLSVRPDPVPRPDVAEADSTSDDSERSALLAQLLQESQQRTAVSQAQYAALPGVNRDFPLPGYGGSFATGGIVPGAVGEARTIIAHGGERVLSVAEQQTAGGAERPIVVQVIVERGAGVDERKIKTVVEGAMRDVARVGARRMPGLAGA